MYANAMEQYSRVQHVCNVRHFSVRHTVSTGGMAGVLHKMMAGVLHRPGSIGRWTYR